MSTVCSICACHIYTLIFSCFDIALHSLQKILLIKSMKERDIARDGEREKKTIRERVKLLQEKSYPSFYYATALNEVISVCTLFAIQNRGLIRIQEHGKTENAFCEFIEMN